MANRVVSTNLWNDTKWANITNIRTRYVWLYLLTCPQSNSCGIFKLPIKYIVADTNLNEQEIKLSIRELQDMHLCIYDYKGGEIAIPNYPIYNLRNITQALAFMVAKGLKMAKNTNLINAVYIRLCKISDENKRKEFEPIIQCYVDRLKGKGVGKETTIGKENHLRNNKVKDKGLGVGLGLEKTKESIYQNTKENDSEDFNESEWDNLIKSLDKE